MISIVLIFLHFSEEKAYNGVFSTFNLMVRGLPLGLIFPVSLSVPRGDPCKKKKRHWRQPVTEFDEEGQVVPVDVEGPVLADDGQAEHLPSTDDAGSLRFDGSGAGFIIL
jgi:hypothetical protein